MGRSVSGCIPANITQQTELPVMSPGNVTTVRKQVCKLARQCKWQHRACIAQSASQSYRAAL